MTNNNGSNGSGRPWGQPKEVPLTQFTQSGRPGSPYEDLYNDVLLRLDATNGSRGIMVPFRSDADAKSATMALGSLFRHRTGIKGFALVQRGVFEGKPAVFVRRGPNWQRSTLLTEPDELGGDTGE